MAIIEGWGDGFFLVGYREGNPCPKCGTAIEKIKAGSTSSYVCPMCQPIGGPFAQQNRAR